MIPLRNRQSTKKFPKAVGIFLVIWSTVFAASFFWPGPRETLLNNLAIESLQLDGRWLATFLLAPNLVSFLTGLFFVWAFVPRLFEWRSWWGCSVIATAGACVSMAIYFLVHPPSGFRVLAPEAFYGVWLGMVMRREIWGSTETLVFGWIWARVYDVPSYVLLFFWLFYLLIGNLGLSGPMAEAPMLYLLPLTSLVWGFVAESLMSKPEVPGGDHQPAAA
jgi:hypothetical protein